MSQRPDLWDLEWDKNTVPAFMSHSMIKQTKWHVRPAKTQINLHIHADSEDWDQIGIRLGGLLINLSLCWVHRSFCWFCLAVPAFVFSPD